MKSVTVVGSGIVGLTSAIMLQEAGFKVKIVSKESYQTTLSSKVGAVWFPFEVYPKEKANHWSTLAYHRYKTEIRKGNGVNFISMIIAYNSESNTAWVDQLPLGMVRKALKKELPKGIEQAFIAIVPLAEPPLYLPHLFQRFTNNGGCFEMREILSLPELATLDNLVINCTGLGARELCNDSEIHPMRGQILRCEKTNIPSYADPTQLGRLSYVLNRSEDTIIGGTDYINDWNENAEQSDTDLILGRLQEITTNSSTPEILEIVVGLRPRRHEVRHEFDQNYDNVFHNYGHGGAGFTVAWGCAIQIADLLKS